MKLLLCEGASHKTLIPLMRDDGCIVEQAALGAHTDSSPKPANFPVWKKRFAAGEPDLEFIFF